MSSYPSTILEDSLLFFFFFFSPLLPCHRAADCFCGVCFWDLHSVPLLCWPALLPVVSLFYFIKNTFWLHIHLPTKGKKLVCDKILRAVKNYNFIKKPTGEDKNVFWETAFHFWKKYDFIKVSTIDLIKMKPEVNLPDNTIWKLYKSFFFVRKLHNSTHLGIPKTTKHQENEWEGKPRKRHILLQNCYPKHTASSQNLMIR